MANVRSGNTHYIDSTGTLTADKNDKVAYVVLTASSANAVILLTDAGSGTRSKIDLRVATAGTTQVFDFSEVPLVFSNGVRVGTLTNAVATIVYTKGGGS